MIKAKWRKILLVIVVIGAIVGISWPAVYWMHANVSEAKVVHNSRMEPIILIPGSSATQNRFNTLITELNQRTSGHSLLKITVKTDGSLTYTGSIAARDNEPYIVVAFQNNADGYNNIKKQAEWFNIAFKKLASTYHFNRFRGIGHSNGGLIFTLFLEKYYSSDDVSMTRLMTIGTPYNLEESNDSNRTQMLQDMIDSRTKLPSSLTVFSLAGTENLDGDGTVPIASVLAGKYIFQTQVEHYTQITVSGDDASHSDLPQNRQIINYISEYMVNQPNQSGTRIHPGTQNQHGNGVPPANE